MIEELIIRELKALKKRVGNLETREHHFRLNLGIPTELTITSGVITRTRDNHTVDTETHIMSTDDLDTINGGVEGDLLLIRAANSGRTVVVKDATGNIHLSGDFTLDHADDTLLLYFDGTNWLGVPGNNTA